MRWHVELRFDIEKFDLRQDMLVLETNICQRSLEKDTQILCSTALFAWALGLGLLLRLRRPLVRFESRLGRLHLQASKERFSQCFSIVLLKIGFTFNG